jgi:hypothetical protein
VVAGTIVWALVLAAAFAGPEAATLLVPPMGLLAGGGYLWMSAPEGLLGRITAVSALALGAFGLVFGALRLIF